MNDQIYHRAVAVQQHPPRMPGKNLLPAGQPGSVFITNVND
jgi:hypothetical protein